MASPPKQPERTIVDQAAIDDAIAKSAFASLPVETRRRLLQGARQVPLISKDYFLHVGDKHRGGVLIRGLVRTGRVQPDGRELTVSWEYPGSILGLLATLGPGAPLEVQAVTDSTFLEFSVSVIHDLARTDPQVALAIAGLASEFLRRVIDEVILFALSDLRSRVEWRLLELSCRNPPGTPLVAEITQEDLARACGAARPSVARVLKELRDEGSIRSMYGGILVLEPQALAPPPERQHVRPRKSVGGRQGRAKQAS